MEAFANALDKAWQNVNSDYEAKRYKDTTLSPPKITVVPPGTFVGWLRSQSKVGGQNKVPRLFNDRTYADQLTVFAGLREELTKPAKEKKPAREKIAV